MDSTEHHPLPRVLEGREEPPFLFGLFQREQILHGLLLLDLCHSSDSKPKPNLLFIPSLGVSSLTSHLQCGRREPQDIQGDRALKTQMVLGWAVSVKYSAKLKSLVQNTDKHARLSSI